MNSLDGLRSFCLELSSDQSSPGGGTAAAASGAMAASLLIMVCRITGSSKKYEQSWPELLKLRSELEGLRDQLLSLSRDDARAYDEVVVAFRKKKDRDDDASRKGVESALKHAAEVPLRTVEACSRVLGLTGKVAKLGIRSASSDVGVASLLAEAGLKGAALNIRINLKSMSDKSFTTSMEDTLTKLESSAGKVPRDALAKLTQE